MNLTYPNLTGTRDIYMDCINAITGDKRESMVDLGVHKAAHTPLLGFKDREYYDINYHKLDFPEEQKYFKQKNVLDVRTSRKQVSYALDLLEHLTKADGYLLLKQMKSYSDKQILFSPLGDMWIGEDDDPYTHKSGWEPKDVPDYASIVFPDYHKEWGFGAWFFWSCDNIKEDFERVKQELKDKAWTK